MTLRRWLGPGLWSSMALGLLAACQAATGQAKPAEVAQAASPGLAAPSPPAAASALPTPAGAETGPQFGPFPSAPPLDQGFKGWELYAWREAGAWRFSLVPGTNATKTWAMVSAQGQEGTALDLNALMAMMARLPAGAQVFWMGLPGDRPAGSDPSPPLKEHQALLQALAQSRGVALTLPSPDPSPRP